jgi:hypothetical protein
VPAKKSAKKKPKNVVVLVALDQAEQAVERASLACEEYYDASHPLIDEPAYRRTRGIRAIQGTIFDGRGRVDQSFVNHYSARGTYLSGRTVFQDGTVTEDP